MDRYNGTMRPNKTASLILGFASTLLVIAFFIITYTHDQKVKEHTANSFRFEKETFVVKGTASSDKIAYTSIQELDLVDQVAMDDPLQMDYFNGEADTKKYGSVRCYVYVHQKPFIIIQTQKRIFVINDHSEKATKQLYGKIQDKMN